jgi:hypothetical protein
VGLAIERRRTTAGLYPHSRAGCSMSTGAPVASTSFNR